MTGISISFFFKICVPKATPNTCAANTSSASAIGRYKRLFHFLRNSHAVNSDRTSKRRNMTFGIKKHVSRIKNACMQMLLRPATKSRSAIAVSSVGKKTQNELITFVPRVYLCQIYMSGKIERSISDKNVNTIGITKF